MATALTASRSPLSVTAARSPFTVVPVPGPRPEHRGLAHWMNRVLEELGQLQSSPDLDTVHDLRVAIRRCRSIATAMEEVDTNSAWPEMRKVGRRLFRALGTLRDTQVMEEWIKKLGSEDDLLRAELLSSLEADEKQFAESALRTAAKFDKKEWTRLERILRQRIRRVPVGGLVAECLALERFEEAKDLHNRALRTEKPKPWHSLRVGLKKFRYTVEGLLPEHYAVWSENLKRLQDLLGDIHDLDVLSGLVEDTKISQTVGSSAFQKSWQEKIARARHERIETYRQLTLGTTSVWHGWRHNLPHGRRLEAAATARLRATARAAGAHSHRNILVSRIALRVFDLLRRAKAAPAFQDTSMRRIMEAAATLHGIESAGEHRLSQKGLRKFLLCVTVPPNWTAQEWDLMAWSVRFQRGAEPKQKNGFAKLSESQQTAVRTMAGTLRLARALRKSGVESTVGLRSEKSADAIVLRVPGLPDTAETAARLAAAKHLLESVLEKPLLLKAAPAPAEAAAPLEKKPEPPLVAVATA
ncbi:MAG TPA: CHAD domain-containing protein [Candidatus Solibacter sp.]|nr:CHAD domain-containing protein [Candidatus Solibacter sp.]